MFDRIRRTWRAFWEKRSKLSVSDFLTTAAAGALRSAAGVFVSEKSALGLSTAWACTRVLSSTPATLPFAPYRRLSGGGREKATDHHTYDMVDVAPNPEMTWVNFFEALQAHLVNYGNAYAEIQYSGAGRPIALWPLLPDRTWPDRNPRTKELFYRTTIPGENIQKLLPRERVLHIAGLGFDGLVGYSVIAKARESMGLAMAAQEFGSRFYGSGTNVGLVFKHPGELSDKAYERLQKDLEAKSGLEAAHRFLILEEGLDVGRRGIPPNEAQFLETRQFQVPEVCRWYGVPPHAVQDLSQAHHTNIEHQGRELVTYTLTSWLVRWEKAFNFQMLTAAERRAGLYYKFNVDALLRGDMKSRYACYAIGRQWGWLSPDVILALEDMDPLPDGAGQTYLNPLNMVPAGQPRPDARTFDQLLQLIREERSDHDGQ